MSLGTAGNCPVDQKWSWESVSAAGFGTSSDYRLVTPGSYRLVDSLGRRTPLSVEAGRWRVSYPDTYRISGGATRVA